jgi:hypothetical protein
MAPVYGSMESHFFNDGLCLNYQTFSQPHHFNLPPYNMGISDPWQPEVVSSRSHEFSDEAEQRTRLPVISPHIFLDIENPWSGKKNSSGNPYDILPENLDRLAFRKKGHYPIDLERYGNPDDILDWRKHQGSTMDERLELLRSIMDKYLSGRQDRMKIHTVVVFTNEIWKTDQVAAVSKLLKEFESSPRWHGNPNSFKIDFHRIEDNAEGWVRLRRLQERFS